ncbi:uncharacterized protein METZ01_LOCUS161120, partial [marine metagenome]
MQVYRGLDIGTAKPSAVEQGEVPHHLIDVVGLNEPFDAAQFVRFAKRAVAAVRSRAARPIFCGGTGLYFRALFDGLGDSPPGEDSLRAELEATPMEALLDELKAKDLLAFEAVDRQNRRRVVRAVEVIRLTGQSYSSQRTGWNATGQAPANLFCVTREVDDLNTRIHSRVDRMFEQGLVAETQSLSKRGLSENRTACQALGYRQVLGHLDGELGLAETVELVKARTRQFAKRQRTWFRNQLNCQPVEWAAGKSVDGCCERLLG